MIYIIGSLTNPRIPEIGAELCRHGFDAFDQWHAAGPEADKIWQAHFQAKGFNYRDALQQDFPQTAFTFDDKHINASDSVVMVMPAGKSGHLELGIAIGRGKRGYILMEQGEPEKWDLMYAYAAQSGGGIVYSVEELLSALARDTMRKEKGAINGGGHHTREVVCGSRVFRNDLVYSDPRGYVYEDGDTITTGKAI